MATNFPNSLDSLTNPAITDQLSSPSHAAQHANANDAIEQLQAKVGVNSSTVTTSHDYKIAQLEAAITAGVSGTKLIYQDVRNQSGASLTKGTPVRVTGSDGASGKLLIASATNATESGSSKTFGLVSSTISNNSNGQVVTNGLLENVDTTGSVDGDPVWLGVNGAKIFGLVNKPSAPAHLVYLGVVVRGGQQNTGSIFVSIQNGFELHELHNVAINQVQNKNALVYDSTTELWKNYDLSNDFVLAGDLQNSLGDYIPLNVLGQPSGPAALDADGNLIVPENKIIIEGATADANELTIQAPDVTSDITVTLPNATGTLALTSDITTAVNNLVNSAPNTLDTLNELATALGNDANFATTTATSIGNKVSKAGGDVITSSLPSVVGLTIKGATSQTADLQQWQLPDSTTVASMSATTTGASTNGVLKLLGAYGGIVSNGEWKIQRVGGALLILSPNGTVINSVYGGTTLTIQSNSGQTANITEWKNSSGTLMARVAFDGSFTAGGFNGATKFIVDQFGTLSLGTNRNLTGTPTYLFVQSQGATDIGAVIKGHASQTANLQEWQNSAGTVLASISPTGKLTSAVDASINGVVIGMGAGSVSSNTSVGLNSLVSNTTGTYNTAFGNQSLQLNTSGTQNTAFGQNALYNNRTGWYNTAFGQGALQNNNYAYSNTAIGTAAMISNVSGSGNTAVGIASLQSNISGGNNVVIGSNSGYSNSTGSGNIFLGTESGYYETGSNKLYIANTNTTTPLIGGDFSAKTLTFAGNATITSQATGTIGLIVKAIASQTANVFEVQNSSGSTQLAVNQYGVTRALAGGYITTNSAASVVLYVDGVTSQTADLQQWRDSSGNVLAKIQSTGAFNTSWAGSFGTLSNLSSTTLGVVALNSTIVPLVAKGASSQTANLQEWQNSAGTVLANVDSAGFVNGSAYRQIGGNSNGFGIGTISSVLTAFGSGGNATVVPVVVRGASGQTANLQEWQDSTGAVIANMQVNGNMHVSYLDSLSSLGTYLYTGNNEGFQLVNRDAGHIPLKIKGAASQTANLTEWQNSSGTVLAKITSTGALDATAITVNGSPISGGGLTPFSISSNTALSSNSKYFVNTSAVRTLTLPASPSLGDEIQVFDASNLAGTNNVTISSNGGKINGSVQDAIVDVNGGAMVLIYTGSTYGWRAG